MLSSAAVIGTFRVKTVQLTPPSEGYTTPMRKSLEKQYRDTCICKGKLHVYLYLSMKKNIGYIVCLSNNINL